GDKQEQAAGRLTHTAGISIGRIELMLMLPRRFAVICCAIVLVAAPISGVSARAPQQASIAHRDRWFTDARGRVLIFHGVNMTMKVPPYQPSALGFGDDDAALLAREGFNTVRLGAILKAIEP